MKIDKCFFLLRILQGWKYTMFLPFLNMYLRILVHKKPLLFFLSIVSLAYLKFCSDD